MEIDMKVIAATNNDGKLREIEEILSPLGIEIISLHSAGIYAEVEETGTTFEENSLIKAKSVALLCDYPVLADDSGLCVDALDGRPGVYSARYAGADASDAEKVDKLLDELHNIENRKAHFVSVISFVDTYGTVLTAEGSVDGSILYKPVGESGFGYDPVFYCDELQKSFAEASDEEKNSVSHRGRALRRMYELLKERNR
jgi:XTP/dITP diphosphohydrolase